MSFTPFPIAHDRSSEARAISRDLADLETLSLARIAITAAIERVGRLDHIHHPDRRWDTSDLLEALQGELASLEGEALRIASGPVVIEEDE